MTSNTDYAGITQGTRNGPYIDTIFFDGRFNSFFVTLDLTDDCIFIHPIKSGYDSHVSIDDVFRSQNDKKMIMQLRNGTFSPFTIRDYKLTIDITGDITFYWKQSTVFNGNNTAELVYGIGIFDEEKDDLVNIINDFLPKESKTYDLSSLSEKIKQTACNPPMINSADHSFDKVKLYGTTLSTEFDFVHISQQAHRDQIYGNYFDSEQFRFYAEKFKTCVNGSNLNMTKCVDTFTPMALADICEMSEGTIDFGEEMLKLGDEEKSIVINVYMASMSGITKSYGPIPPYKYDVVQRPWFDGIKHTNLHFSRHKVRLTYFLISMKKRYK